MLRSSGSIYANYTEANESLSKKDSLMRIKIARKEAKESIYWMDLLEISGSLKQEATEIMIILGSIVSKIERNK